MVSSVLSTVLPLGPTMWQMLSVSRELSLLFLVHFDVHKLTLIDSLTATSVASKSITLKQAVIVASICEFCGVLFLGASVASTVRGKIFNVEQYEDEPEIVMLGMFTSLVSASFMMLGATYFGLPVSTTHTVSTALLCIMQMVLMHTFTYVTNSFLTYLAGHWMYHRIQYCSKRLWQHQLG